ncbi:hypothetical protein RKLH11_1010 [Rhodobacteraceae bacterium KLH11]|nr:hypothetical protein RKLH11_1010 [Rhodobacteraceae bacterium KLH11]
MATVDQRQAAFSSFLPDPDFFRILQLFCRPAQLGYPPTLTRSGGFDLANKPEAL